MANVKVGLKFSCPQDCLNSKQLLVKFEDFQF
jgi:hypothetical protein